MNHHEHGPLQQIQRPARVVRKTLLCQSCESIKYMYTLQDDLDPPFLICANCLTLLVNHVLSKENFKNLLKNGHSTKEFLLHEDFYADDGTALQPALLKEYMERDPDDGR